MEMEARRYDNKGESKCVIGEEITVDWRGKPSNPNKHGGMRAAAFVLGMSYSLSLSPSKPNTCVCVCVCVCGFLILVFHGYFSLFAINGFPFLGMLSNSLSYNLQAFNMRLLK